MTALNLRLQKHLEHGNTTAGAVATLRRVTDAKGAAVRGGPRLEVTIPANNSGQGKVVPVEPGRWLVEATLPSGEILSEETNVPEGHEVPVTLHTAEHSPHEWLGWQHLNGNIEGFETLEQIKGHAREAAFSKEAEAWPRLDMKPAGSYSMTVEPTTRGLPEMVPAAEPEGPVIGFLKDSSAFRDARAWKEILGLSPRSLKMCECADSSPERDLHLYRFLDPVQPNGRAFAHVDWGGERYAVSLPIPWTDTVHQHKVPVEMMVRLHPLEKTVHIGVAALDSEFGTLAGLMTASTLPKAKVVVEQAHHLLFDKFNNPLAAAAGGYILLATGGSEEHPQWHGWIKNLYKFFPDLPDGAVLEASRRLLYPQDESSYDQARKVLFEAFDRGIPYFSAGVARLLDGLTLFAADSPEAQEKTKLVQHVAQRLDLSQAFTVIRLSDKVRRA